MFGEDKIIFCFWLIFTVVPLFLFLRSESRKVTIYIMILLVVKHRERKTSGYFVLECDFHADARFKI